MPEIISKTRIIAARQCRRRLWLEANRPDVQIYDSNARRRLSQGQRLHNLLRRLYPDGALIDEKVALPDAISVTAKHLARNPQVPLFEARFSTHQVWVRADIFRKTPDGFELTEVKSSTRLKPHYLFDCALQNWVISRAGYPVQRTLLAHVDKRFEYGGDEDYSGLLKYVDVTERIADLVPEVPGWIDEGLETLSLPNEPDIPTGPHCTRPFACPFMAHCMQPATEYPVGLLPGGGRIISELVAEGIEDIRDIPEGRLQKPLHRRVRQATLSGKPYIAPEFGDILQSLPYPRYYLDFEAIQFAIPRWAGTRPYQQLPFQWSCHIESAPGQLQHAEFLDNSGDPPMRACAQALVDTLGGEGPIFSYSRFERSVIHQLGARFPDLRRRLNLLAERLVDLLPLVKAHYYHPAMKGAYSLKAVLPTVAPGLSYDGLGGVQDGIGAQIAYESLIDANTPAEQRRSVSDQLRGYCWLDTLAMVRLVRFFENRQGINRPWH
ncbi:MAG: DUF2779 domain-containing protein [Sedimenticolaceae bacterium]